MVLKYSIIIVIFLLALEGFIYSVIVRPSLRQKGKECDGVYYQKRYREDLKTYHKMKKSFLNLSVLLFIIDALVIGVILFFLIYAFILP